MTATLSGLLGRGRGLRVACALLVVASFIATARGDLADWAAQCAVRRPEVPERTVPSAEQALRANGGAFDEEREIAAEHLPFALPDGASWSWLTKSERETLAECAFSAADGSSHRFAVYGQDGCKQPYYWTGAGYAAQNPSAGEVVSAITNFLSAKIGAASAAMRLAEGVLCADEHCIREGGIVVKPPFKRFRFVFLDDRPGANWEHPCRYVFLSEDLSSFAVSYRGRAPSLIGADGARIPLRATGARQKRESLDAVKARVYNAANAMQPKALTYKGDVSHSYFLIIVGGADVYQNGIRFWADAAMFYSTLRRQYNVPKQNILVCISDGTSYLPDANLGDDVDFYLVDSPRDLDGDGYEDVNGPANPVSVKAAFAAFEDTLTANDQLVVFISSHGAAIGTAGKSNHKAKASLYAENLYEPTYLTDAELQAYTKNIACPVAFIIETCFSGGFIDDILATPRRMIATACNHYEVSYGRGGGGTWGTSAYGWPLPGSTSAYNHWAVQMNGAFRGAYPLAYTPDGTSRCAYPWESGLACHADVNGDGLVSMREASNYARKNDTAADELYGDPEHPQYAESTGGLGLQFYLLKQSGSGPDVKKPDFGWNDSITGWNDYCRLSAGRCNLGGWGRGEAVFYLAVKEPATDTGYDYFALWSGTTPASISISGLPSGLSWNKSTWKTDGMLKLSGAPSAQGLYTATVTVKNQNGYTAVEYYRFAVGSVDLPDTTMIDSFLGAYLPATVGDRIDPDQCVFLSKRREDDITGSDSYSFTTSLGGLPTGLKNTPKGTVVFQDDIYSCTDTSNTVFGVMAKAGKFTVKYTEKKVYNLTVSGKKSKINLSHSETKEAYVYPAAQACLEVVTGANGTVKGGGLYARGAAVKLVATAAKGYVFAGWYRNSTFSNPLRDDYGNPIRAASATYAANGTNERIYARFVKKDKSVDTVAFALPKPDSGEKSYDTSRYADKQTGVVTFPVPVDSLSAPTVKVKGLPAGLKYDAKSMRITGTPSKPGEYEVTLTAANVSGATQTATIVLKIPNLKCASYGGNDSYVFNVGVDSLIKPVSVVDTDSSKITWSVSQLPSGLKFAKKDIVDSKTRVVRYRAGSVYGVPKKACTNTVYFTATVKRYDAVTKKWSTTKEVATATFKVDGLRSWATGTFNGGDGNGGIVTLTVSGVGKISGKFVDADGASHNLSAPSFASYASSRYRATLAIAKSTETIGIELSDGIAGGVVNSTAFTAYQDNWKHEPLKTVGKSISGTTQAFSVKDNSGNDGVLTLKFAATGKVTVTGVFTTGVDRNGKAIAYTATGSSVLIPEGAAGGSSYCVYISLPPKSTRFSGYCARLSVAIEGRY